MGSNQLFNTNNLLKFNIDGVEAQMKQFNEHLSNSLKTEIDRIEAQQKAALKPILDRIEAQQKARTEHLMKLIKPEIDKVFNAVGKSLEFYDTPVTYHHVYRK